MEIVKSKKATVVTEDRGFIECKLIAKEDVEWTEENGLITFTVGTLKSARYAPNEDGWDMFEYIVVDTDLSASEQIIALAVTDTLLKSQPLAIIPFSSRR
jgi:hypothetical protein